MKEGRIGVQEAVCLITITITVKVYFTSPAYLAQTTGTASWYVTLISATTAILAFMAICSLLKRFPGKDFVKIFELSLGRIVGGTLSVLLCIFLVVSDSILLREFAEILKIYILPLTPISFVLGTVIASAAAVCFLGLESIARFSKFVAYVLLIGYVVVIVLNFNHYDYHNLFPLKGYGLGKTVHHGFTRSSFYEEIIILGLIAPSLQGIEHIRKAGIKALIISGFITSSALAFTMMALNYATAQEITSRLYSLTRLIHIGGFIQRFDPLFIFPWNIGSLISISIVYYASVNTYCKTFKMQDMRPAIIPFGIIIYTISIIPKDFISIANYVHILRENGWIVAFGVPIIVLVVAILRDKGSDGCE